MKNCKYRNIIMMLVLMLSTIFVFSSCDKNDEKIDEPKVEQISPTLILGYWREDTDVYDDTYSILKDKIIYKHEALVQAEGTYSFDGKNLIADYTRVIMDVASYDGFVCDEDSYYGKPCKKTYTILSCDGNKMIIKKPNGEQVTLTKYADVLGDTTNGNGGNLSGSEIGIDNDKKNIIVKTNGCPFVGAIRAIVSGTVFGVNDYVEAGIIYGKSPNLLNEANDTVCVRTQKDFSVELKGLLDDEQYYYCGYCVVDDIYYYGSIEALTTHQLTYTIDGKEFKMIKVEGDGHSFSIMQTELVPNSNFVVDSVTYKLATVKDQPSVISVKEFGDLINSLRNNTYMNFRLPTRAEWEYAAKGGQKSQGYTYSGSNNIDEVAWYSKNSNNKLHEIASKKPNELGLYDMSGNYAEVCHIDPSKTNDIKYIRAVDGDICGGCWKDKDVNCTSTSWKPGSRDGNVEDSWISEYNSVCSYYYTVRLIYTRE